MSVHIEQMLASFEPVSAMVRRRTIRFLLESLDQVLANRIDGAVVELGCNQGTSSLFFRRLLDHHGCSREFHVYDSWEGLPEPSDFDLTEHEPGRFRKGSARARKEVFVSNFKDAGLRPPVIHDGWFKDIPDDLYPAPIAFAFLDGDFYSSILDSLDKVYAKLSRGASVCIHDCGNPKLPGARRAVEDFLQSSPEALQVNGNTGFFTKI